MSDASTFPIQLERGAPAHPLNIPWPVAERAYSVYAARYGTGQSLQRIAERGGFAPSEMDAFLPGWRDEASEIARLRAEAERLARERDEARGLVLFLMARAWPTRNQLRWPGDCACARCYPHSKHLAPGFVCQRHRALDIVHEAALAENERRP